MIGGASLDGEDGGSDWHRGGEQTCMVNNEDRLLSTFCMRVML